MKLSNSWAKAGPMSGASDVGLACVPRLDLDYFESQSDSPRLNQRLLKFTLTIKASSFIYDVKSSRTLKSVSHFVAGTRVVFSH